MKREPVSYTALQMWARSAISVFYRRTDVTRVAHVPLDRPVLLAANHSSALGDVAVIVAKMPRFPHFLAASTWWKSPPARLLFRLGGVVPIHRRRDADPNDNLSTFAACHAALDARDHLAIFPEGEMQLTTGLLPLKTGAARIALGAAADAGVEGVAIVPVGLVYEDRGRFRSDTEICFGEPIEIDEWLDLYREDAAKAIHGVMNLLADRLSHVAVRHASPAEAALVDHAAAIALAPDATAGARRDTFAQHNAVRRALTNALALSGGPASKEYVELEAAVAAHARDLDALGIDITSSVPDVEAVANDVRQATYRDLVVLTPPALAGLVANAPVLLGAKAASLRVRDEGWQATVKGVAGTFLCAFTWSGEYVFTARRFGRRRALVLTAASIGTGAAALAWHDQVRRARAISWRDRASAAQPEALATAQESGRRVRELVTALTRQFIHPG
jgi:1-acyl-sn-glycerol-3-phosphate acyltransferase